MRRYCKNCDREFEVDPVAVSKNEKLTCPLCKGEVLSDSKKPSGVYRDERGYTELDGKFGRFFGVLFSIGFVFYMLLSLVGIAAYVWNYDKLLYGITATLLAVFLLQLITDTLIFRSGVIFLPAGALASYFGFDSSLRGLCLGILVVRVIFVGFLLDCQTIPTFLGKFVYFPSLTGFCKRSCCLI